MSTTRRTLALLGLVLLSLLALGDAVYLSLVHIDLETGAGTFGRICHALSRSGCEVTGGRFGEVFGIPVAVLGGGGALAILLTATVALRRRRDDDHPSHAVLIGLTGGAVLVSVIMALLSTIEGAYCPFCVLWYLLNLLSLVAAVIAGGRSLGESLRRAVAGLRGPALPILLAVFVGGVGLGMAAYLRVLTRTTAVVEVEIAETIDRALAAPQVTGLELREQPRRRFGGPGDPLLIVEFSDFECPYCRLLWEQAERTFAATERPLEVVFVNFPLDRACNPAIRSDLHPQACLAAFAGECAHREGKFWEFADQIFVRQPAIGRAALLEIAEEQGLDLTAFTACLDDPATAAAIDTDVRLGGEAGVKGTPMVLIDGYRFTGVIRRPVLEGILRRLQDGETGPVPTRQ